MPTCRLACSCISLSYSLLVDSACCFIASCSARLWVNSVTHTHNTLSSRTDWVVALQRGVVVSGVRQWTKLTHVGPGYNWDGWPSSGGYTISSCNQPTRSTQPCIPPGSLNRVPASDGVKAGRSPLPGGRQCCVIPYGMWWCEFP